MKEEAAKQLIRKTFESSFDNGRFIQLIKELFNHIEILNIPPYRGKFTGYFEPHIQMLEMVGKYEDPEKRKADILVVHLKKQSTLERARTAQRNFIAWYLNSPLSGGFKDAAFVAFVSPDSDDWRFSLVKMEYRLEETKSGKVKAKEELTPARRWSFLVGKYESSHTAQNRLIPLLMDDQRKPALKDFEEAFNIEKVTKEFFSKYRELFIRAKESLDDIVAKDRVVAKDFADKGVDTVNFSKKLLGQIVFLYFLQKKGWFGVKRGKEWGGGSKHFLRELFDKKHGGYRNFFNDILEPLFYEALRLERPADYYSRFECRIPFLNGGLFDPINDYNWQDTDILLPNGLFANDETTKEGDTGTGILDVFDRYNFTVKEDEPLEKEVAIDPEMLGKVFENLLEVKDRKSKGTYYTPREIVHYMCQESLINYLHAELNPPGEKNAEDEPETEQKKLFGEPDAKQMRLPVQTQTTQELIPKEALADFIHHGEMVLEYTPEIYGENKDSKTGKEGSGKFDVIFKNARVVDEKLKNIRVCDPAAGSGAFLVGMMNEIVRARNALSSYPSLQGADATKQSRTVYDFKRHAIQSCLYGVDIDAGAVEIAKLRLWLSLVVDEDERETIQPLPNLDYKIVCGNSLLGVEQDLLNDHLFKQLETLKPLHFDETSAGKKQKYKEQIDALIKELTHLPAPQGTSRQAGDETKFDFEIYFSEVFHEKKGFDVVIANPPYVRHEQIKEMKPLLKKGYSVFTGTTDIYAYFYELAHNILKLEGILSFITSNKYMRAAYGVKLRQFFKSKLSLHNLIDFGDLPVFQDATSYPSILIAQKRASAKNSFSACRIETMIELQNLQAALAGKSIGIVQNNLPENDAWNIEDRRITELRKKIEGTPENTVSLKKYVSGKMYRGILTGYNTAFVIDEETRARLIREDSKSDEIIKPFLRGKDVKRYKLQHNRLYLIFTRRGINMERYPAIKAYLSQFKKHLTPGVGRKLGTYKWYEIQDSIAYWKEFEKAKIVYPNIFREPEFAFDQNGYYANQKCFIIPNNDKFLLGFLNSKVNFFLMRIILPKLRGEYYEPNAVFFSKFPIHLPSSKQRENIETLVNKILAITKDGDYLTNAAKQAKVRDYEREIDALVYKLYDLTPEEIAIVEGKG